MFVDMAKIWIRGGKGGDGAVAFHRENMLMPAAPMGETAVKAAILFFRRTAT